MKSGETYFNTQKFNTDLEEFKKHIIVEFAEIKKELKIKNVLN